MLTAGWKPALPVVSGMERHLANQPNISPLTMTSRERIPLP
jgi:hypothetical protein